MKNKNILLIIYTVVALLFIFYIGFIYLKQTSQLAMITDLNSFQSKGNLSVFVSNLASYDHLKQLGFSETAISSMSKGEIQQYEKVNGKIVYRETLYRKITNSDLKSISKAEYKKLLIQYSKSKFPRKTT